MVKSKLKSCPFCGGKAEMCRVFGRIGVACSQCDANFRSESICGETGYDDVIAAWNRRTNNFVNSQDKDSPKVCINCKSSNIAGDKRQVD